MNFLNVMFSSSDVSGCGWIRSFLPARHLNGHFIGGFSLNAPMDGIKHVIFQRHTHKDFIEIIPHLQSLGKKVYYDLDDDLWSIHESNPAKNAYPPETLSTIEKIISLCDGVFTSTEYLKNKLTTFNPSVNVIPNLVEIPSTSKEYHHKIRIGYSGSLSHKIDFSDKLIYALRKLYNKYSDRIEFIFFGYIPPELREISYHTAGVEPNQYLEALNYVDLDIGLIPLADIEFNKSKSNLKWLNTSICKAVPVVSDVHCYSEVEDQKTGFKIYNDKWYDVLEQLINNKWLIEEMKNKCYEHVLQNYTWQHAKWKQEEVYEKEFLTN